MHEPQPEVIRAFLDGNHLSQAELAKLARVSQSTVSRALIGPTKRHSEQRTRLFEYMQENAGRHTSATGVDRVMEAFNKIWDRTDDHAAAIAGIIEASAPLRPVKSNTYGLK